MMVASFVVIGVAIGTAQAFLLRRVVRRGGTPFGVLSRLLVIGGTLAVSALCGHLVAAALGWALGSAATTLALAWRWS